MTITLSSCAASRWAHPTKNQAGSYLDLLHCKQTEDPCGISDRKDQDKKFIKNEIDKCMQTRYGWIKKKENPLRYYLPFPFNLYFAYQ